MNKEEMPKSLNQERMKKKVDQDVTEKLKSPNDDDQQENPPRQKYVFTVCHTCPFVLVP